MLPLMWRPMYQTLKSGSLILDVIGGLTFRRLWNYTILTYGCEEHSILNGELSELSKYLQQ